MMKALKLNKVMRGVQERNDQVQTRNKMMMQKHNNDEEGNDDIN